MKEVAKWFTEQDFLNLMNEKADKTIIFSENITFYDGKEVVRFSKEYESKIVQPRGTGISIENVSEFDGSMLGEKRAIGGYNHKPEEYICYDYVNWYSEL